MRKVYKICFFLLFLILGLNPKGHAQKILSVMVDAGHGGKDNGTTGSFSKEKDIVLDIAKLLAEKSNGIINIQLTRDSDEFLKLDERSSNANQNNVDLFISLHCNHIHLAYVNGTEVYVYGHSNDKEHNRIVERENGTHYLDQQEYEDISFILGEIEESAFLEQSILCGDFVTEIFDKNLELKQRGLRQANFRVLKNLEMPGVLLEIAYLSNPANEKYINSRKGKQEVADALWLAIEKYHKNIQKENPTFTLNSN